MGQQMLDTKSIKRVAGLELNALLASGVLPESNFQKATLSSKPLPVYDINGEILFYRISITRAKNVVAFADIASNDSFAEPLLSVSHGQEWDEKTLLEEATKRLKKIQRSTKYDTVRLVAYSYPKLAFQFLFDGKETSMLELYTWEPVPPLNQKRSTDAPAANFERWSFIDNMPKELARKNSRSFNKQMANWDDICPPWPSKRYPKPPKKFEFIEVQLDRDRYVNVFPIYPVTKTRELHYSTNNADHHPCYELRGQQTNVWCVGASVQMLLDFYRYNYTQVRLAQELGLGTLSNPNGLPYSRVNDVVTVIEKLTSNALNAAMNSISNWSEFVNEIDANRPLISFIPGHSRTVAGYTQSKIFVWHTFRGLLVYDPWPPTTGVITRWENFANQTYHTTFTAKLTLV